MTERTVTHKPSFLTEWLTVSRKDTHTVLRQIERLSKNPLPDGNNQIKLKKDNKYRLRAGHWRVTYDFNDTQISLISLRRRNEKTYKEKHVTEIKDEFNSLLEEVTQ